MKLNPDCVRDILLAVEEATGFHKAFEYSIGEKKPKMLGNYSFEEVLYHIRQCEFSGFLYECNYYGNGGYVVVDDLTPTGHEFLSNTRKNTVWEKVKEVGDEIGSDSLKSLAAIAGQMILQLIKSKLPLT